MPFKELATLIECTEAEEMVNQVKYVPIWASLRSLVNRLTSALMSYLAEVVGRGSSGP